MSIVLAREYHYNQQDQLTKLIHLLSSAQRVLARLEDAELGVYADTDTRKISVILTIPEPDEKSGIDLSEIFKNQPGNYPRHVLLREDLDCVKMVRQPDGRLTVAGEEGGKNGNA
jgi:hypothetical protein